MGVIDRVGGAAGSAASRGTWLARGAWLLAVAEGLVAVKNHLSDRLTPSERQRLIEIVKTSRGRPGNLSNRERRELQKLISQVEPATLAKNVAQSSLLGRRGRRR